MEKIWSLYFGIYTRRGECEGGVKEENGEKERERRQRRKREKRKSKRKKRRKHKRRKRKKRGKSRRRLWRGKVRGRKEEIRES